MFKAPIIGGFRLLETLGLISPLAPLLLAAAVAVLVP